VYAEILLYSILPNDMLSSTLRIAKDMKRSSYDVKGITVPLMNELSGQSGVPDQVQNGHVLFTITCIDAWI
jgi:hypothetical protein